MKNVSLVPLDLNNEVHIRWMFTVRSHEKVIPYFFAPAPSQYEEHVKFLKNSAGKREFFIVMQNKDLCGYCQLVHHPDSVEVGFALHPDWWGKGIGTYSAAVFLKFVHSLAPKKIILYVKSNNKRAIHLYEKLGFSFVEEEDGRCLMVQSGSTAKSS